VRFLGQLGRSQTLTWIAAADLVLTASLDEGAPTVVREARALGTPVVARAAGDLVEWARRDPGLVVLP
jgi:glycosyltransferase involved in cell wall biosynthesis